MASLGKYLRRLSRRNPGQDMVEYALIMALISVIAIGALQLAGASILGLWTTIATSLPAS